MRLRLVGPDGLGARGCRLRGGGHPDQLRAGQCVRLRGRRARWDRRSGLPPSRRRPPRWAAHWAALAAVCECAPPGQMGSALGAADSEAAATRSAARWIMRAAACGFAAPGHMGSVLKAADFEAAASPLNCALGSAYGCVRLPRVGPDWLGARGCRLRGGGHPLGCFGNASRACGANRSLVRASRDGRASFWRPLGISVCGRRECRPALVQSSPAVALSWREIILAWLSGPVCVFCFCLRWRCELRAGSARRPKRALPRSYPSLGVEP